MAIRAQTQIILPALLADRQYQDVFNQQTVTVGSTLYLDRLPGHPLIGVLREVSSEHSDASRANA